MNSNELMIGNYVRVTETRKILSLTFSSLSQGIALDIEGVPITEELLLKFGFQYYEEEKYWQHFELKAPYVLTANFSIFESITVTTYKKDWVLGKFSYVHELQNWWFSVCKTQLVFQDE